jgi:hypothetical protein
MIRRAFIKMLCVSPLGCLFPKRRSGTKSQMPVPPKGCKWGSCSFTVNSESGDMGIYAYEYDGERWTSVCTTEWKNYERVK